MNKPISFSPVNTKKYLEAIHDAGFYVGCIEITANGTLRVFNAEQSALMANREVDEYEVWEKQQSARSRNAD